MHHLVWQTTRVAGRPAVYGVAGKGEPLVFLHGWGLAHRAYRRALKRLVRQGVRVYAPAMPGFGGTDSLPSSVLSLEGYAGWVNAFIGAVRIRKPVTLVGHSFGGGVAIQVAHDWPNRVGRLVVVNSVGGSAWSHSNGIVRTMRERPLWDWGLHMQTDIMPMRQLTRVIPVILGEAVPNLLRNPHAFCKVAHLAATADLTEELEVLKRRRLPVVILWGQKDTVIPAASIESLRAALGDPHVITVPGSHTWLLADPDGFGEVMTNVIAAAASPDNTEPAGA